MQKRSLTAKVNNNTIIREDEMVIPPNLFEIQKRILFLQAPLFEANG